MNDKEKRNVFPNSCSKLQAEVEIISEEKRNTFTEMRKGITLSERQNSSALTAHETRLKNQKSPPRNRMTFEQCFGGATRSECLCI